MTLQFLVPQYNETDEIVKPLLDSIALQQNVDFEEINPQKNQQKSIKNPSENQQKTNNKEKDKGIKEKDKEKCFTETLLTG